MIKQNNHIKKKRYNLFVRRSLILKINILMMVMVTIFFIFFGFLDYIEETETKTEALNSELSIITNRLTHTLLIPIWDLDLDNITDTIVAEMQNKNIQAVIVFDSVINDILIAKTRDDKWNIVDLNHKLSDNIQILETREIIYNSKKIAYLEVLVTDKFIKKEITAAAISQAKRTILLIIFFIIILSVSLFIAILKPIKKLTNTIRDITEGNINESIEIDRDDEIGELAKDFTIMRNTVKQKINSLNIEITERKEMEKELHNLRNYLSNIIDSMPSVLVGVNLDSKVMLWNRTAEQTTGISVNSALGKELSEVFPRMAQRMKQIAESILLKETIQEQKKPRQSENGTCFEDITIYPLIANGVKGAVIRIDDVTDKIRMQEMMIQSEKMLSVGGLAAGMAHEINNPLAGMMQTANVMYNRLGGKMDTPANLKAAKKSGITLKGIHAFMEERDILHMTQVIRESGERVAVIVNNILSFARKSDTRISSHPISELIDKTLELASADYDLKKQYDFKHIAIQKEYEENLPLVPCEETKIQQVLLNIFRNGAQSMAIKETKTDPHRFIIRTYFEKERKMVCLEIEDNGPGIDEETCKRVFEPFFTTKPIGEGTGLGLSVSYFIITENHKGEMTMKSTPGIGSTFIIKLPID